MNKNNKEFLEKCVEYDYDKPLPLFKGIFIIQQRKLHSSGYRMMYVIGHTEKCYKQKGDYILIGTCSDVVDFQPIFGKLLQRNYDMCDLHLDIDRDGMIHIWTNTKDKYLKCEIPYVSTCTFEIVERK